MLARLGRITSWATACHLRPSKSGSTPTCGRWDRALSSRFFWQSTQTVTSCGSHIKIQQHGENNLLFELAINLLNFSMSYLIRVYIDTYCSQFLPWKCAVGSLKPGSFDEYLSDLSLSIAQNMRNHVKTLVCWRQQRTNVFLSAGASVKKMKQKGLITKVTPRWGWPFKQKSCLCETEIIRLDPSISTNVSLLLKWTNKHHQASLKKAF